jgi:hypothetical protein
MSESMRQSPRAERGLLRSALVAATLLLWCWQQASAQTGQLVGQVVDATTGQPVAFARITVDTVNADTDEMGMFQVAGLVPGRRTISVARLGYAPLTVDVAIEADRVARVRLTVSERAIALAPLNVDALSPDSILARGGGSSRRKVTRAQIAQWEGTNMRLADVLRTAVPSVRVRQRDSQVGADVCIELRSIRAMTVGSPCLAPAVYLDGVPITNATNLFANLDLSLIESVEVVPATEAGVRFGTGALYGALLIETRRPGRGDAPLQPAAAPSVHFDWKEDPQGHRTGRVLVVSTATGSAGLLVGLAIAGECLRVRRPAYDALVTDCSLGPTLGAAAAALILPAVASSVGARIAGETRTSRGRSLHASVAAVMVLLPGYALVLSGQRNDSDPMQWIGRGLIGLGAPAAATWSDYLFRSRKVP